MTRLNLNVEKFEKLLQRFGNVTKFWGFGNVTKFWGFGQVVKSWGFGEVFQF